MSATPKTENSTSGTTANTALPDCPACLGKGFFRSDAPVGDRDFGRLVPCDHPSHSESRLARLAGLSNLLPSELKKRVNNIKSGPKNKEVIEAAREMVKNPQGWLYLYGKAGNAKSDVLLAVTNEINATGRGPALYVEFARLLNWITEAHTEAASRSKFAAEKGHFPDSQGYMARLDRIVAFPVICIDEFDKARMTDFREEFLFEFLNLRWRQAVDGTSATLFASQTAPIDWPDPIRSRIEDGRFKIIHNLAPDGRRAMQRGA